MVFEDYYNGLKKVIDSLRKEEVDSVLEVLKACKSRGGTVYLIGNGGSASTSEHWVNDLIKIGGLRAVSLTNISVITALGNDISYDDVFVEQLKTMFKEGDVVVGITGSGNSPNVVKALEYVLGNGGVGVGVLGFKGGRCLEVLRNRGKYILVETEDYGFLEDIHLSLAHYFARVLKKV
jgi:D-sedoheptulose 7-phosphate isomerase